MRSLRGFFAAFIITLCVLGLVIGLYVVGYNSRLTMSGSTVSYRVENGRVVITDDTPTCVPAPREYELLPAPARLFLELLTQAARLLETFVPF